MTSFETAYYDIISYSLFWSTLINVSNFSLHQPSEFTLRDFSHKFQLCTGYRDAGIKKFTGFGFWGLS